MLTIAVCVEFKLREGASRMLVHGVFVEQFVYFGLPTWSGGQLCFGYEQMLITCLSLRKLDWKSLLMIYQLTK